MRKFWLFNLLVMSLLLLSFTILHVHGYRQQDFFFLLFTIVVLAGLCHFHYKYYYNKRNE
ncbi:hypothetical protein [Alkalihalobacillus sp. LMS39]|uniref:hypothetical protein n=1 Tax=Alkalihalobacillus sp. LMS39 TaxID=2924032 RepID=UPI001FB4204D|nr:hypothetical protein [Alkalihalobacillus sp. LMS39]UOE94853.1 hypothetical protein MM271_04175 [Alkalihalobacillus sp. LMS39]